MPDSDRMDLLKERYSPEPDIAELLTSDVRIDLHIHTCYSDGELTPQQVVDRWQDEGYKIIAITDHDGMQGSVIGMDYSADKDIRFISGIEFDSFDSYCRDIHMLGYGFDYNCPELREALLEIALKRARRNDQMREALGRMGYEITLDDIGAVNEGRHVGKPTFATILYRKGYLSDPQEAFRTVFRRPEIKSIVKETLDTGKVIELIHHAGGLAVLAHPMEQRHLEESFDEFRPRLYNILDRIREYGVDGIECCHPSADEEQQKLLADYADHYGLIKTRGSDFHTDRHKRNFSRYHMP